MKNFLEIFSALAIFFLSNSLHAQIAPSIEWQKCLGGTHDEQFNTIEQTSDHGYIVAGTTPSNNGDVQGNHGIYDCWVVKLDSTGNLIWQKCLGGSAHELTSSVIQTSDGGYIIGGVSDSNDGDVSGNHAGMDYYINYYGDTISSDTVTTSDCWIVKLDSFGNIQWQKSLGGSGGEGASSIQQTIDGGFIVAGSTSSNDGDVSGWHAGYDYDGYPTTDYWVAKLNSLGNLLWQKCFGGSDYDLAKSIQQTPDGGYIVAGGSYSNDGDVSSNHGDIDYWVVKLDSVGNLLWEKSLGGPNYEYAFSVQQVSDGGFIVAGTTESFTGDVYGNHGMEDYWVVKLDTLGNLLWQKCLGGWSYEIGRSVIQTADGGFVVAGMAHSDDGDVSGNHSSVLYADCWIVKLDSIGNLDWQKCLGGTDVDHASWIQQTSDDGFIVSGITRSNEDDVSGNHLDNDGYTNYDYWVVKLSPDIPLNIVSLFPTSISISPNPITTQLQIQYTSTQPGELMMYDALGRKVKSCSLPSSQKTFQLSLAELPAGVYLVAVNSGGQSFVEKVVKE